MIYKMIFMSLPEVLGVTKIVKLVLRLHTDSLLFNYNSYSGFIIHIISRLIIIRKDCNIYITAKNC